jgi:UDP:flavonoid glycosyltransferase YjiC (YdhE family)
VKVLCTCIPAIGHFEPLLPLAQALAAAGHELLFATAPGFHAEVRAKGFAVRAAGLDLDALIAATEVPGPQGALRPDQRAGRMFARIAPRAMLQPLLDIASEWRADVLVHEEGEYAAPLVAHLLGLPNVAVGYSSPMRPEQQLGLLDKILAEFWVEAGAEPRPFGGIFRCLFLDPCPPTLQTAFGLALPTARRIRPSAPKEEATPAAAPEWRRAMPAGPVVHVTFGTVAAYNTAPEIYQAIIDGLAGEGVNLLITVGKNNDPAELGPQREDVRVERFIPHAELLPHCDAVVTHGGAGSTVAAMAHGLPLVVIPAGGAAQTRNGLACEQARIGRMVEREQVSAAVLRAAILDVLHDSGFRARARAIAAEIRHMPPPAEAVREIEELAARR